MKSVRSAFFSKIPIEIKAKIYSLCYKKDLLNLALCNKENCEEIIPYLWESFVLCLSDLRQNGFVRQNLKHTMHFISYVGYSEEVDEIMLYTSDRLKKLSIHDAFQEVTSPDASQEVTSWSKISLFESLRHLELSNCVVSDEDINNINNKNIQKLELVFCQNLTAKCLQSITNFASLQDLTFSDLFRNIDEAAFVCLHQLENLVRLNLSETDAGDALFQHAVGNYRHLKHLELRYTKVTDTGLFYISKLPEIAHLDISLCEISDEGLSFLGRLASLKNFLFQKRENLQVVLAN